MKFNLFHFIIFILCICLSNYSLAICKEKKLNDAKFYIGAGHSSHSSTVAKFEEDDAYDNGLQVILGCNQHIRKNVEWVIEAAFFKEDKNLIGYRRYGADGWLTAGLKLDFVNRIHDFSAIARGGLMDTGHVVIGVGFQVPFNNHISIRTEIVTVQLLQLNTQVNAIYYF